MAKYTEYSYVPTLPKDVQASIKKALTAEFTSLGLSKREVKEYVDMGMNSRLVDLEDAIDYKKYLKMANQAKPKATTAKKKTVRRK